MPKVELRLTPELRKSFPDSFLWGASISAHQAEGDTYNQWTKWEQEHAAESTANSEGKWGWIPVWDDIRSQALDPANYISGHGVHHFKYYQHDFKILKALGLNSFRFNLEWSRIEPEQGTYNLAALRHYKAYIKTLLDMGITPIVGLWHWTNPVWFDEIGGFSRAENLQHWRRYVEKIADELDWTGIKYVTTLNEANTYVSASYLMGEFPHRSRSKIGAVWTYYNMAKTHKSAYKLLKLRHPQLSVGIAHQVNKIVPKDGTKLLDKINAWAYAYWMQWWFLGRLSRSLDFLGVNYYFTDYRSGLAAYPSDNPRRPLNDLGWYMEPSGLKEALVEADRRLKVPILITENGLADMNDKHRLWWITETVHAIAAARRGGVKLLGYCHWSLLDNFEWQYGWFPKFGLIAVDRKTYARRVKTSAKAWGRWLRHR